MELMTVVYFAGIAGGISQFLAGIVSFCIILAVLCGLMYACLWIHGKETSKLLKRTLVTAMVLATLLGGVKALVPTEKTVYMMLGAYTAQSALQSETATKVMLIVNKKLDQYLTGVENDN